MLDTDSNHSTIKHDSSNQKPVPDEHRSHNQVLSPSSQLRTLHEPSHTTSTTAQQQVVTTAADSEGPLRLKQMSEVAVLAEVLRMIQQVNASGALQLGQMGDLEHSRHGSMQWHVSWKAGQFNWLARSRLTWGMLKHCETTWWGWAAEAGGPDTGSVGAEPKWGSVPPTIPRT